MNEEEKEEFTRIKKQSQEAWLDDDDIKFLVDSIEKLQKENKELKEDLKYVLNQTLGAFEKQWCIDWNFTEIREKYNLESE